MPARITSSVTSVRTRVWYTVAKIGTMARAASQDDLSTSVEKCHRDRGIDSAANWDTSSLLGAVVRRFDLRHFTRCLLRPLRVARAMSNDGFRRQARPQLRPAIISLDSNPHRHALHNFS